jgi:hypothetical protein
MNECIVRRCCIAEASCCLVGFYRRIVRSRECSANNKDKSSRCTKSGATAPAGATDLYNVLTGLKLYLEMFEIYPLSI